MVVLDSDNRPVFITALSGKEVTSQLAGVISSMFGNHKMDMAFLMQCQMRL